MKELQIGNLKLIYLYSFDFKERLDPALIQELLNREENKKFLKFERESRCVTYTFTRHYERTYAPFRSVHRSRSEQVTFSQTEITPPSERLQCLETEKGLTIEISPPELRIFPQGAVTIRIVVSPTPLWFSVDDVITLARKLCKKKVQEKILLAWNDFADTWNDCTKAWQKDNIEKDVPLLKRISERPDEYDEYLAISFSRLNVNLDVHAIFGKYGKEIAGIANASWLWRFYSQDFVENMKKENLAHKSNELLLILGDFMTVYSPELESEFPKKKEEPYSEFVKDLLLAIETVIMQRCVLRRLNELMDDKTMQIIHFLSDTGKEAHTLTYVQRVLTDLERDIVNLSNSKANILDVISAQSIRANFFLEYVKRAMENIKVSYLFEAISSKLEEMGSIYERLHALYRRREITRLERRSITIQRLLVGIAILQILIAVVQLLSLLNLF